GLTPAEWLRFFEAATRESRQQPSSSSHHTREAHRSGRSGMDTRDQVPRALARLAGEVRQDAHPASAKSSNAALEQVAQGVVPALSLDAGPSRMDRQGNAATLAPEDRRSQTSRRLSH